MMNTETFFIGAYWKEQKINCLEYLLLAFNCLKFLGQQFDVFKEPKLIGNRGELILLQLQEEQFIKIVFPYLQNDDALYYTAGGKSTENTLESFSDTGYYSTFSFGDSLDIKMSLNAGHHKIKLHNGEIYGGSIPNSFTITLESAHEGETNAGFIKQLFTEVIRIWNPEFAYTVSKEFRKKIVANNNIAVGWINFFNDKSIGDIIDADFRKEIVNDGIYIYLSEHSPSIADYSSIEKAIRLRNQLQDRIKLTW